MQFESLTQVVRLLLTVYDAAEGVKFALRKTSKHRDFQNIARAVVWHFELSTLLNLLSLFTIYVIQQRLTEVHSWPWHSWGPVESWIVPLGKPLLSQTGVLTLVWNVVFVEPNLKEGVPLWKSVLNLLRRRAFRNPFREIRVVERLISSQYFSFRNVIGCRKSYSRRKYRWS